jgi:hypothetical protein
MSLVVAHKSPAPYAFDVLDRGRHGVETDLHLTGEKIDLGAQATAAFGGRAVMRGHRNETLTRLCTVATRSLAIRGMPDFFWRRRMHDVPRIPWRHVPTPCRACPQIEASGGRDAGRSHFFDRAKKRTLNPRCLDRLFVTGDARGGIVRTLMVPALQSAAESLTGLPS